MPASLETQYYKLPIYQNSDVIDYIPTFNDGMEKIDEALHNNAIMGNGNSTNIEALQNLTETQGDDINNTNIAVNTLQTQMSDVQSKIPMLISNSTMNFLVATKANGVNNTYLTTNAATIFTWSTTGYNAATINIAVNIAEANVTKGVLPSNASTNIWLIGSVSENFLNMNSGEIVKSPTGATAIYRATSGIVNTAIECLYLYRHNNITELWIQEPFNASLISYLDVTASFILSKNK